MKWPVSYSVSIALHIGVLLALSAVVAHWLPAPKKKYVEVSLLNLPSVPAPEEQLPVSPPEQALPPDPAEPGNADAPSAPGDPVPTPSPARENPAPPSALPEATGAPPTVPAAPKFEGVITRWRYGGGGRGSGLGGAGHYYEAVHRPRGVTWYEARDYAAQRGGYLVVISTARENEFVFHLIENSKFWSPGASRTTLGPWIGGFTDDNKEDAGNGWEWLDKEAFLFRAWADDEPDNRGGRENRLHFFTWRYASTAPTWNDLDGGTRLRGFVVEYDHDPHLVSAEAQVPARASKAPGG